MELLDTDDPKHQLLTRSARHREQLEEDVKLISERTEKIITNALIIGGALAATYFLISRFSDSKRKAKKKVKKVKIVKDEEGDDVVELESASETPGMINQITAALVSQATAFLLALAKEKLTEIPAVTTA